MPLELLSLGPSATRVPFGRVCKNVSDPCGQNLHTGAGKGSLSPRSKKIFPGIMSMSAPKIAWGGLPIRVGVIGGSGLYKLDGIEIIDVVNPETVRPVKRLV